MVILNNDMSDDELRETYRTLNSNNPRKYLHHLTHEGLGYEMKQMGFLMMYCLKNGFEFRLCLGWHRYAQEHILENFVNHAYAVHRHPLQWLPKVAPLGKRSIKNTIGKCHTLLLSNTRPQSSNELFEGVPRHNYLGGMVVKNDANLKDVAIFLRIVYNPNQTVVQHVNAVLANLKRPYMAVHIRRGDKLKQLQRVQKGHSYLSIADFWRLIVNSDSDIKNIVVVTDDYSAFLEFEAQVPAGYTVSTFCDASSTGYIETEFNHLSQKDGRDAFLRWFVDMELLLRADWTCVAHYYSFGRMAMHLRQARRLPFTTDKL